MFKDKDTIMSRITMKQVLVIITYTIALVWMILHIEQVLGAIGVVIGLIKPFLYGIIMAYLFNLPLKYFLRKLPESLGKARRIVAAICALLVIIIVITFLFSIVVPQVIESVSTLANALPGYLDDLQKTIQQLIIEGKIPIDVLKQIENYANEFEDAVLAVVKNGLPHLISMASGFANGIANFFMGIVIAVYLTVSKKKLQHQLHEFMFAFLPEKTTAFLVKVGRLTNETFAHFVSGQLLEAIIIGVLCYIGCLILHFPYAPILSVIIGCTNFIPIFGAILGVGLSALLVAFINPLQGVFFVLFGIVLQQFESNLIYPKVVGNTVGLSGLWVLFAITLGGGLFGFKGMILGLPIFSILYSLLREEMHRKADEKREKQRKALEEKQREEALLEKTA